MTVSLGQDIATATSTVQTVQANRSTQVVGRLLGYTGFAAITPMGAEVQEGNWGSGLQSFLMFLYLAIVDQSAFRQSFGWKQATLWAVEEPESSMHRDLAIRLAEKFRDWTGDDKYRLQILSTTHNDVFVMTATSGYFVRMNEGVTELAGRDIANLTRMASRQGITSWSHPLLSHPINAVVLVEGLTDAEVLAHAAAVCGVAHHVRFVALKDLDDDAGNGADQVAKYVREHRMLLTARPTDAPFMVLFDWDVADGPTSPLGKSRAAYLEAGSLPIERVIQMDEAQCNPLASSDIRGIERFYPSDVFEGLDPEGELQTFVAADGTFTFGASGLSQRLKARLRVRMLERTDEASFSFLRPTLEKIQALAKDAARSQASLDALLAGASEE